MAIVLYFLYGSLFACMGHETGEGIDVICRLIGVSSIENIDTFELDRLESMLANPLPVNVLNIDRLIESGLFSKYQAVSIVDYIEHHGQILSLTELGSVDGIGEDYAIRIAPFVSLSGNLDRRNDRWRLNARTKAGFKTLYDGNQTWSSGLHAETSYADKLNVSVSFSKTLSGQISPESFGGNIAWYCQRIPLKVVVGDYNARYGQGLALWNGMGMNGFAAPAALIRRPTGLSPSTSYSSTYSLRGMALQWSPKTFRLSTGISLPGLCSLSTSMNKFGLMPFADLSWLAPNGQLSFTSYLIYKPSLDMEKSITDAKSSITYRWTLKGIQLFAELAYDWISREPAGLAGGSFAPSDNLRLATMVRYYPRDYSPTYSTAVRSRTKCSNEHSISMTGEFIAGKYITMSTTDKFFMPSRRHVSTFYVDISHIPIVDKRLYISGFQTKAGIDWKVILNENLLVKLRASERFRSWGDKFRSEIRADVVAHHMSFFATWRIDCVCCRQTGFLTYLEGGCKKYKLSICLRSGVFFIDNWQDRIYVYERDAPGAFNVPAFFGRGLWVALSGSWKFLHWGKVYFRLGTTAYPFHNNIKKKPGNAELKLQLNVRF